MINVQDRISFRDMTYDQLLSVRTLVHERLGQSHSSLEWIEQEIFYKSPEGIEILEHLQRILDLFDENKTHHAVWAQALVWGKIPDKIDELCIDNWNNALKWAFMRGALFSDFARANDRYVDPLFENHEYPGPLREAKELAEKELGL